MIASRSPNVRPLIAAGILLGIGMGGFVDGILFHQILQLHNMLSNVIARDSLVNEQANMFWDGIFHAFTWLATAAGVGMLWRVAKRPEVPKLGPTYLGAVLLGWGTFNLVEGICDHEILQLHHVYENGSHLAWDMVFLGFGIILAAAGWTLIRRMIRS